MSEVKSVLLTSTREELASIVRQQKEQAPEPLNRKFMERNSKPDAIKNHLEKRQRSEIELFPPGEFAAPTNGIDELG